MVGRRTTRLTRAVLPIATLSSLAWVFLPERVRRPLHRASLRAGRALRYRAGRLRGVRYRVTRRHPDPGVPDEVLADRVRSSLGPLEKQLDVPRVHLTVEDHVVLLHGEVPSASDARKIERGVLQVSGVLGAESYLHIAPIPKSARPSGGGARPKASPALERLVEAAFHAGAPPDTAPRVVRAVMSFLAERVPPGEFAHLASHLPEDVRAMCAAPRRRGVPAGRVRTVHELVSSLASATAPLSPEAAEHVVESVLGALRDLVPEEAFDIAAVLPEDLRDLWLTSMAH